MISQEMIKSIMKKLIIPKEKKILKKIVKIMNQVHKKTQAEKNIVKKVEIQNLNRMTKENQNQKIKMGQVQLKRKTQKNKLKKVKIQNLNKQQKELKQNQKQKQVHKKNQVPKNKVKKVKIQNQNKQLKEAQTKSQTEPSTKEESSSKKQSEESGDVEPKQTDDKTESESKKEIESSKDEERDSKKQSGESGDKGSKQKGGKTGPKAKKKIESSVNEQQSEEEKSDEEIKVKDNTSNKSNIEKSSERKIEDKDSDEKKDNKQNQKDTSDNSENNSNDQNDGKEKNTNENDQNNDDSKEEDLNSPDLEIQNGKNEQQDKRELTKDQKEKLRKLRAKLKEYDDKKRKLEKSIRYKVTKKKLHNSEEKEKELEERDYKTSDKTNQFLKELENLPDFNEKNRGDGYSIDADGYTDVPDSIIRTLITKFLNQRFCKKNTDLNVRSNSLEKSKGFHKWEVGDVIVHLKTHQITKVFDDKYGYQYAEGKSENVPLSFYFDMSGSMSSYSNQLAVIAIELLKKDVKVLIGFNEVVNVQIDKLKKNINVEELAELLENAGDSLKNDSIAIYKSIDERIDKYLISKKAEKCVVFTDFDPKDEVCRLSHEAEVYWFCFKTNFTEQDLIDYNGFIYPVQNIFDIADGLIKVNSKRFETLCYSDNPKALRRKK